ncbi:adapter protein CIKS-like isoform X2 [Gouania willdenowi]|nr:adapter protein CIKS-like isoform X2 [Gouania willdenowi]
MEKCSSGSVDPFSDIMLEDGFVPQLHTDEHLEPPLPLKDEDEGENYRPTLHQHMPTCVHDCYCTQRWTDSFPLPCPQHYSQPQNWLQQPDSLSHGGVSVNVPLFSVPPVEELSQLIMMNSSSAGDRRTGSHPHEKMRTISLPPKYKNLFLTYSSDLSSEIPPFVDFLTKQGFRVDIDLFENPVSSKDAHNWNHSYLRDPSVLIIVAISPKYKSDIEGSVMDSYALHTKYIHSMMQNEFIQQGSINYRFIPVLFFSASQKHVPSWLQNTHVYRWPQETEDLLLRLLREERFIFPSVPGNLSILIRPVTMSATDTQ